ncbi:MAG: ATP-binding protein [Candidatus Aenigmarchaeota archaeon]|nr:ATP-binding protein [Candidatus Aenigmarchaeota archaeon]
MLEIRERLVRQNPWWQGKPIESIREMKKRELFSEIIEYLDKKQILAILGLRRVGKTVLVYQIIEHLIGKRIDPRQILYFSFDELLARDPNIIENVLQIYEKDILMQDLKNVYIIFDEISHVNDWQVILKRFYDMEKRIKIIVTGSAGIQINKAKESLAGRIYEFELKPLNFREFLMLKGIDFKDVSHSLAIRQELVNYLMKGGFPEIMEENDFVKARKYVNSIVEKIVLSDIPKVYDVGNPEILREIFYIIAKKPGCIIEFKTIAETLNITYQTVSKYLHYLERAYLIKSLYNYRGSPIVSARKSKKIYLSTTSLSISSLDSDIDFSAIIPAIAENAAVVSLNAKYFWREYYELDIIHDKIPFEVKYGEPDIRNNINAVKKLKMKRLVVITKDIEKKEQREGIAVQYIPLWRFLLKSGISWKE